MQLSRSYKSLNGQHRLQRSRHRAHAHPAPTPPPFGASAAEVVAWAQQQFLQEVSREKADSSINLAKVCLLLALEEEAAANLPDATQARTSATASTWSLNRLDALAAEVVDTITALDDDTAPQQTDSSSSSSVAGQQRDQQQQQQHGKQAAAVRQQAQRYPMQVLNAVNAVLFRRHGYSACNRYGASVDSQLSTVLEIGTGSVAALTILYLEVCSRLGMDCGVKVVEDGRYCLVWPRPPAAPHEQQQQQESDGLQQATDQQQQQQQQQGATASAGQQEVQQLQGTNPQRQTLLSVGGDACVVDVYGEGALLPVREATELFGITEQQLFAGSSRRELLAALLSELQTSHWCAAVGCSPSPALMTPLTAATAVGHAVRQLHGASIECAAAAAAKRVVLLPQEPQAQLDLALLCYFSGRYDDAWLELGSYLEQLKAAAEREIQQQQQQDAGRTSSQASAGQQPGPATSSSSSTAGSSSSATVSSSSSSSSGSNSSSSSGSSSATSRVTELHAAIQSMLIGGAAVPEQPPPAAAPTAAEAALASADEEDSGSKARRQQEQELDNIVLLFQKLQLELMVAANKEG